MALTFLAVGRLTNGGNPPPSKFNVAYQPPGTATGV